MTELPIEAFPIASYAENQHSTPERVHADSTEHAHMLYISGLILGTPRSAEDTKLLAGIELSRKISQESERYGAQLRAELEGRERERKAELAAAGARATERSHPYANGHTVIEAMSPEMTELLAAPEPPVDDAETEVSDGAQLG